MLFRSSIVELAESRELFQNPLHPYTKILFSSIPSSEPADLDKNKRIRITGELSSSFTVTGGCRFAPRCSYKTELCLQEVPKLRELEKGHFAACHNAEMIS